MTNKIKSIVGAIEYLRNKAGYNIKDISKIKWKIWDNDYNFTDYLSSDKQLIEYANEQKEAIEN